MNDSHATVVTKYFAKITILFLQCSHCTPLRSYTYGCQTWNPETSYCLQTLCTAYLIESAKSPGLVPLGRTRKLPYRPCLMSKFRAWVEVTCMWNHLQENGWLCTITISYPSNFTYPTRPNQPNELIAFQWFTRSCVIDPRCTRLGLVCETKASLPSSGHI